MRGCSPGTGTGCCSTTRGAAARATAVTTRSAGTGTRTSRARSPFSASGQISIRSASGLGLSTGADVLIEVAPTHRELKAVVSDGATFRSYEDIRNLAGIDDTAPFYWPFITAVRVFSGSSPGEPLEELVARVSPTPLLLIASGDAQREAEVNRLTRRPRASRSSSGRSRTGRIPPLCVSIPRSTSSVSSASSTGRSSAGAAVENRPEDQFRDDVHTAWRSRAPPPCAEPIDGLPPGGRATRTRQPRPTAASVVAHHRDDRLRPPTHA